MLCEALDTAESVSAPLTERQRRRQILGYCKSKKTQAAIRDAVFNSVQGITIFDCKRILDLLATRLDDFGDGLRLEFRAWAVAWVSRAARVTAQIRPLLAELADLVRTVPDVPPGEADHIAGRLLNSVHLFPGDPEDVEALRAWANEWVIREVQCVVPLAAWVYEHEKSVRDGLWAVLGSCRDLGANESEADELACDVWAWVVDHVSELMEPGEAPLSVRLKARARCTARAWKTQRLRERKRGADLETEERARMDTGRVLPKPQAE